MAVKYLSNRVKDLQVGITNYSENKPKSLYVVGNVGIGTTNPTAEVGISNTSVLAVGILTAYRIYSSVYGEFTGAFSGGTVDTDSLNVTGISTLGTVKVSGGIVTATAGVVTYYGDGQYLTGIAVTEHTDTRSLNVSGLSTFGGNIDANADLDVDGHTNLDDLVVTGVATFNNTVTLSALLDCNGGADINTLTAATAKISDLTDTRIVIAGTNGELADSAQLRYVSSTLTVGTNLDVDGHTELDDVNVGGAITATTFTGNLTGTVNTAAQPNITSLGTLGGLSVSGTGLQVQNAAAGIALDVTGYTELDTVSVASTSTFSGAIDANGGADISGGTGLTASTAKISDLTDNRIVIAGTSGELEDTTKLTFDGTTLAVVGDATFTGNVSIAGTLTKEDVTNIDSVGLVTAQTGVRITSGGLVVSSGVSTFTDAIDANGGANISGGSGLTASSIKVSSLADNNIVVSGANGELINDTQLTYNRTTNVLSLTGNLFLPNSGNHAGIGTASKLGTGTDSLSVYGNSTTSGVRIWASSSTHKATSVPLQVADSSGTELFRVHGDGNIGIGIANPSEKLDVSGNIKVSGDINANGNIIGDAATNISGINSVTATTFFGSGSELTDLPSGGLWVANSAGIHTTVDVGIGTTNPSDAVNPANTKKLSVGIVSAYELYVNDIKYANDLNVAGVSTFVGFTTFKDGAAFSDSDGSNYGVDFYTSAWIKNNTPFYFGGTPLQEGGNGGDAHLQINGNSSGTSVLSVGGNSNPNTDILLLRANNLHVEANPPFGHQRLITVTAGAGVTISGDVSVTGIATFTDAIDSNGGANVDGGLVANSAKVSDLTSGRVVVAGTAGELEDASTFTFSGGTVTATNFSGNLTGTLQTAAQANVTSVGTLTGLNVSGDSTFTGNLNVSGVSTFVGEVNIDGNILLDTPHVLQFGHSSQQASISHTSSNLHIANAVGDVYITTVDDDKDIIIQTDNGSGGLVNYFLADGSTGEAILYHYGTERIKTSSSGAIVTGVLTATSFSGDGSALTNIGGGTLISGITIKEEGSTVGVAGSIKTLDFVGDTVTATASGTTATITVTGAGSTDGWIPDAQENLVAGTGAGAAKDADTCFNILLGCSSGAALNAGDHNLFFGAYAGKPVTSGSCNIAIGLKAGCEMANKDFNVFIGRSAGQCATGDANVAIGNGALYGNGGGSGGNNIALGRDAMGTGNGGYNVAIGRQAGNSFTTGCNNVLLGTCAGCSITSGCCNISLGTHAGKNATTGNLNVALGYCVELPVATGSNQLVIGAAGNTWITGDANFNVGIGTNRHDTTVGAGVTAKLSVGIVSAYQLYGDGSALTGISAGFDPDAQENLYAGTSAGCCSNTHACFNVAIGYTAGSKLGSGGAGWGQNNVFIGKCAGAIDTNGLCNTFIGGESGKININGFYNTFLGYSSGSSNSTANGNVYVGFKAGSNANAYCNTFLGAWSGKAATGACNVAIGQHVALANNSGAYQLAIGSGDNNWIDGDANFNVGIGTNRHDTVVGAGVTAKLSVGIVSTYQLYAAQVDINNGTIDGTNIGVSHRSNANFNYVDISQTLGVTGQTTLTNLNVAGIVTATSFSGDGSNLVGVAKSTVLEDAGINTAGTTTLNHFVVTGISTFGNNIAVTGTASATDFNSTSDIRLKTNIKRIEDPLSKVVRIEGVTFDWKEWNRPALGVIADQVQEVIPELVQDTDPKTVNYNGLIGLLIEAVKEQQTQIDDLKSRLSKLE